MSEHDNIPTPRTLFEEIRSEIIRVERELATVTEERDYAVTVATQRQEGWERCEYSRDVIQGERDSLRDEVERLKARNTELSARILRWQDFTVPQSIELREMKIHAENNPAPAQSEPSQAAEVSHLNTVPLTQEEAKMTTSAMMQEFEEPSQIGGKELKREIPMSSDHVLSQLIAAQATIAELEQKWEVVRHDWHDAFPVTSEAIEKLRAENAALRAERDEAQNQNGWITEKLLQSETQLATAIAERNAEHQFGSQMQAERDSVQSQLNAERVKLGAAIADRDELQKGNEVLRGYSADFDHLRGNLIATVRERDSALAACAAKTDALHEIDGLIDFPSDGIGTHVAVRIIEIIKSALSPAARIDYVPKVVATGLRRVVLMYRQGLYHPAGLLDANKRLEFRVSEADKALTAAAPFLTDSTREEGK